MTTIIILFDVIASILLCMGGYFGFRLIQIERHERQDSRSEN